jgi:hypothetical protein
MDLSRNELLGEIAADAALERREFLVQATEQLRTFLAANADRIKDAGGFVLIDEEPDYLAVAPDGTFRSRTRYQDEATGKWVSETEVIESPSELIELYNAAEVYAAFAEAARVAAGLEAEPTAAEDLREVAGLAPDETVEAGYAGAADAWAATTGEIPVPDDPAEAARVLYDLALTFQERSQEAEASLIEEFETAARELAAKVGDIMVLDEDDERLIFTGAGRFVAEVVPEEAEGEWKRLGDPTQLVEFYDPTDVFGDLADALADAFEGIAADEEGSAESDEDDAEDEGGQAGDGGDGGGPRAKG